MKYVPNVMIQLTVKYVCFPLEKEKKTPTKKEKLRLYTINDCLILNSYIMESGMSNKCHMHTPMMIINDV